MQKIQKTVALTWLMQNTPLFPKGLGTAFAKQFKVSRAAAATYLKQQVEAGYLIKTGSSTRPVYSLGRKRSIAMTYSLPGVDEALIWEKDFVPYLNLSKNVSNICHFGVTEMINNANDHSGGSELVVFITQNQEEVNIQIEDNGIGIFKKIADTLHLSEMKLALLELSKGKFTTDQKNHSGEGIFFTSRAFDVFCILANNLIYHHSSINARDRIDDLNESELNHGTLVKMAIALKSQRTLKSIFDTYTSDPEEMVFDKTVIPVRLAQLGSENLISRSQAKRLLQRIDKFRFVELNFSGVKEIGQSFADEIFRVFAQQHPEIKLESTHTNKEVASMISRALKTKR